MHRKPDCSGLLHVDGCCECVMFQAIMGQIMYLVFKRLSRVFTRGRCEDSVDNLWG